MSEPESNPILIAGIFMVVGIPLWFFDHWSRKSKNIYDMNWWNAGFIGTLQALSFLPGVDLLSCALIGAFFCNYRREVAVKYAYFASAPILLARASTELKGVSFSLPSPMPDFSWLSFCTAILVTLLVGLLTIGGFLKHVQNKGMGQYLGYRVLFALGVFGFYWVHRTA